MPPLSAQRVSFAVTTEHAAQITDPVLADLLSPRSPAFEGFRLLSAKVKGLAEQRPLRCLGVASATRHEGTSAVTLGLAAALAQEPRHRVLVVEATVREPSLERILGLPSAPGLSEWLGSEGEGPVMLRRLEPGGFDLLAGGQPVPAAQSERLGSDRMALLLSAARESFEFVVVDCPPLELAADSVILQDLLDGFLLVVRARHAPRDAIRRAFSHLKADLVRGVVFNDHTEILTRWLDRRRS